MNVWRCVSGNLEVELTGADPEQSIEEIVGQNMEIRKICKCSDLTYRFLIPRKEERNLRELCSRRGDTLRIKKKIGLYWLGKSAAKRPVLLLGVGCFLFWALWVPSRVFFVQVEGNERIPARQILAAAEESGVSFGASRREVRSERVKNALLSQLPELQWAGVNTAGCTATVSVREKTETDTHTESEEIAGMLAARDGYILSATATAGTLLVKPGDSVRKDQVLISAYTDCGICIRAQRASGEIMAQTNRSIQAIMPARRWRKGDVTREKRRLSLLLRKKRINLWKDSGIWGDSCGRMYEEYYITLPGGFRLPAAVCVETYVFSELLPEDIPETEAEAALEGFSQQYLSGQMIAGKILTGISAVAKEEGRYHLRGTYACTEMIGILRQEQIGDTNGKNG